MWEKIVLNLISNAFKYTPEGRVDVRQRTDGDLIVLEVADTGVGVEPDQVPHLFERFYRASGPWARSQEGTGIGLAVAKELTELHGGTISVDTAAGEGSRFVVSIPIEEGGGEGIEEQPDPGQTSHIAEAFAGEAINWLVPGPAEALRASAAAERTASSSADPAPDGHGRGRTAEVPEILVADDNADMRRYLERLLGRRYAVRLVADGSSALREARRRPPDLVLADVMMPGLDGFELLAELRADPELASLPIVLLSARAGEQASVEGIEAGADDYLAKPFTARELLARVGTNIALARARDEARDAERQARKKAEEAVNARARFMANTSHELRTPLNAVMAYLELLLTGAAGDIPDAQRAYLERIRSGAEHLKQIIEEILTFARLEAGTERGVIREVDLADAVRDITALIRPLLDEKGLTLTLDVPDATRPVRTDVAKVRQILLNLLSNAYKYTEKGGVTVRMGQASDDAVTLAVADTGPGIEAENRDRIFEAFWRGPSSESGGGTGLGLNVARTLARLLGGDITLDGSETGSTFTLTLPSDPEKRPTEVGEDGGP
jgi:signal transduction histidine kinase